MELDEIVALSVKHNASDLHLCCGHLPWWRCQGRLVSPPDLPVISEKQLAIFCQRWLNSSQQQLLHREGHCDAGLTLASGLRLRVCVFRQQSGLSLALRLLRPQIPSMESLGLPPVSYRLIEKQAGLILVCGATGCGKSTSMAAMIAEINRRRGLHIITLEDPVEYLHHSTGCLIQQRQAGADFSSFHQGLIAALRQDPDIIMIGELRDHQTIRHALMAAETGHLVLSTLHTVTAAQAPERLTDSFPAAEKNQVRAQLAGCLSAVIAQRLTESDTRPGQLRAVFEVLINTPAVASVIREGRMHQLPGIIQTGAEAGMQSFPPPQGRGFSDTGGLLSGDRQAITGD